MATIDVPPASLKHIKKFLDEAKAREKQDPLVAYHLRLHALQEAMEVRSKIPKEDMAYILTLMDAAEAEKNGLGQVGDQGEEEKHAHVENFALELFEKADNLDRAGQSTLSTAKIYNSAYHVMEACKQFHGGAELPEDLQEKLKYAKWRVVEIAKATKERRQPPPPRGMEGATSANSASTNDGATADSAPPTAPPEPPVPPAPGPSGEIPLPPPPDYLGLPPPPPPVGPEHSFDASILPGAPVMPPGVPPPVPPGWSSNGAAVPPPTYAPPQPAPPTNYTPGRPQMLEAHRLTQSATNALEFQDHVTAIHAMRQALQLLTLPPSAS